MKQNNSSQTSATQTYLFRYGQCIVYRNGDIDVIYKPTDFHYEISHEVLRTNDWIRHMGEKNWVDMDDFRRAFALALSLTEKTCRA